MKKLILIKERFILKPKIKLQKTRIINRVLLRKYTLCPLKESVKQKYFEIDYNFFLDEQKENKMEEEMVNRIKGKVGKFTKK